MIALRRAFMKNPIKRIFRAMSTEEKQSNPIDIENSQTEQSHEEVVADGPVSSEEQPAPEALQQETAALADWETKYNDVNDRYLRLYSDFDNYKKRVAKERIELSKTAAADIFAALLPVLDDFDRASKAMEMSGATVDSLREGVQLVHGKLKGILTARGLEEMDATGQAFDAEVHEAITQIPAPDESLKGKVIDQVEKGYSLNGKVIRYAKVVVGS